MIEEPPFDAGAVHVRLICAELAIVPDTEVGAPGVVAATLTETVLDPVDVVGAKALNEAEIEIVPAAAVPVKAKVIDVALFHVALEAVSPVVPTPIVKSESEVVVSKLLPVIVTDGLVAPFAIVLVVDIEGVDVTPTVYEMVLELPLQFERPVPCEFPDPVPHALMTTLT